MHHLGKSVQLEDLWSECRICLKTSSWCSGTKTSPRSLRQKMFGKFRLLCSEWQYETFCMFIICQILRYINPLHVGCGDPYP